MFRKKIFATILQPYSDTGNSDVERMHLSLLEHIRILKHNNAHFDTKELVIRAIGFYNNTIHSTIGVKPIEFLNCTDINYPEIARKMHVRRERAINRVNSKRGRVPKYNKKDLYIRNSIAMRQKTAKRFLKYIPNHPNKIYLANIKRPLKSFSGDNEAGNHIIHCAVGNATKSAARIRKIET